MGNKTLKKIVVILVYLIVIALVSWFFYLILKPKETCSDKIKNQNEEDVDCGGICAKCSMIQAEDLMIGDKGYIDSGVEGKYDFWAIVSNPNNTFGGQSFRYKVTFKDAAGAVAGEKDGQSFILPGDKKYIIENNVPAKDPRSVELSISDVKWTGFNDYYEKPHLNIVNRNYSEISSGTGFSEAKGLLKNESPFDFGLIKVKVILRDETGKVLALNSTEINTVKSQEEREIRVSWPTRFPGKVSTVDAESEVNIFDSETFLERYFKEQQFQKY